MASGPVAVCRTSELSEAGAYVTQDVAERPLLVTRDIHGGIHAFENLCRHRGVRLVHDKSGVTKSFTCLLHGWTYGMDGAMGGFPLAKLAQTNPMLATIRENNALIPLPFEIRHGFVWVAPRARDGVDVAAHLGPVDRALAGRALDSFAIRARTEEPIVTDFLATVRSVVATDDHVHILSDDTVVALHPRDVSIFTLVRRRPDMAFFDNAHPNAIEHLILTPS